MYLGRRSPRRSFRLTYLLLLLILLATLVTYYLSQSQVQLNTPFDVIPTPTRTAEWHLAEAEAYYGEGQLDVATAAYYRAIELDPTNMQARLGLSRLLLWRERSAEALQQAQEAVVLEPSNAQALAVLCRAYDWEGLFADAFDACECSLELGTESAETYAYLGETYADTGAWGAAKENVAKAEALDFQNLAVHRNKGYVFELQGKFTQAAESYENAIFLAPKLAPLYVSAGRAYRSAGRYTEALDRFQRVTRLEPENPVGFDQLGWTYYMTGDYSRAGENLEWATQLDPDYAVAWGHLGILNYVMQQYEEAINAFQKAIELYEKTYLRDKARRVTVLTQDASFDPPRATEVLQGTLYPLNRTGVNTLTATLRPVVKGVNIAPGNDETCGDLILAGLLKENPEVGLPLASQRPMTATEQTTGLYEAVRGIAELHLDTGRLSVRLEAMPQPAGVPYEVQVVNWPEQATSMGYFQPDTGGNVSVEYGFGEVHPAPIEYYYSLGFSYVHLEDCAKGLPWLLLSLDLDPSPANPAWQGLDECPQQ